MATNSPRIRPAGGIGGGGGGGGGGAGGGGGGGGGRNLGGGEKKKNNFEPRRNRRQAQELSVALSREEGQRAELKEFAPIALAGTISADRVAGVAAAPPAAATAALGAESGGVVDPGALTLGSGIAPSVSKPAAQPAAADAANPVPTPELRQLNEGVDLRNEGAVGRVMARAAAATTRPVDAATQTQ